MLLSHSKLLVARIEGLGTECGLEVSEKSEMKQGRFLFDSFVGVRSWDPASHSLIRFRVTLTHPGTVWSRASGQCRAIDAAPKTGTDLGQSHGAIGANGAVDATLPPYSPGFARFSLLDTQKVRGSSPLRPTMFSEIAD